MSESTLASLLIVLLLVGMVSVFLALVLLPPFFFLKARASYKQFAKQIRILADQKGWQTSAKPPLIPFTGSLFPLGGQLPNGQNWYLDHTYDDDSNCSWVATLSTPQPKIRIEYINHGRYFNRGFLGLKRYKTVGSAALHKKYMIAASDEQVVHQLLSPAVESYLLSWQPPLRNRRRLSIFVNNTDIRLYTVTEFRNEDVEWIVGLGTAMTVALSKQAVGQR